MHSYHVEVDLRDAADAGPAPVFRTRSTIRFSCLRPGAGTWVDTLARDITHATLNDRPLTDADRFAEGIRLAALADENELSVDAVHTYAREGHGLHRFVDPADGACYVYSHFQTTHARRAFACFDQPDLKARYHLSMVVPQGWEAVSNTPVLAREELPGGAVRCTFRVTDALSTYHIAFAAGPFARVDDSFAGGAGAVPLGLFCRRSLAGRLAADELFDQVKTGLGFFAARFGVPFPFPKLDVCFVPEFGAGAMENAGCIIAVDDFLYGAGATRNAVQRRDEMLLHEIAHMWFGNLVTLRWWDDLWLNEAFATWAALWAQSEIGRFPDAWALFASTKKAWAYAQDGLASTHPVACAVDDVEQAHFDYITYAKGAALLRQLVAYTGVEAFLAALKRYFEDHRYATATSADLLACLDETSGVDVHGWAERWLRTTGPGVLRADFAADGAGRFTRFRLVQDGPAHTHRPQRVAVGVYRPDADGTALVRVDRVTVALEGADVAVPALVGRERGTLVLPNDGDLGYCRVRLDPASVAGLRTHMAALHDPLARALCWSSLWDMVQDAVLSARVFLPVVVCGMATEQQSGVLQRVLRQARTALTGYVDPQWAASEGWPAYTATLVDGVLVDGVLGEGAGADRRLTCCRALADAPLQPHLLDRVQDWCAGRALPEGLTLDEDLRWRLLAALAAHGRVSAADIDAGAQPDEPLAAQARRERARAALPDAAAKAAAWQRAVLNADVPVAVARAAATGFAPPGQRAALAPFARRYFADIPVLWRQRPAEQAGQLSRQLFPWWGTEDVVAAGTRRLLQADVPPALHRIIEECGAEFSRAAALRRLDCAPEASRP